MHICFTLQNEKDRDYELKVAFDKYRIAHSDHLMPIALFIVIIGLSLENILVAYMCVNESVRFELRTCKEVEFRVQ